MKISTANLRRQKNIIVEIYSTRSFLIFLSCCIWSSLRGSRSFSFVLAWCAFMHLGVYCLKALFTSFKLRTEQYGFLAKINVLENSSSSMKITPAEYLWKRSFVKPFRFCLSISLSFSCGLLSRPGFELCLSQISTECIAGSKKFRILEYFGCFNFPLDIFTGVHTNPFQLCLYLINRDF